MTSTTSLALIMILVGFLGFMLWALVSAAIERMGKKRKEVLAARSGLPLEVDTGTGE